MYISKTEFTMIQSLRSYEGERIVRIQYAVTRDERIEGTIHLAGGDEMEFTVV